jgi:hypothetical protein
MMKVHLFGWLLIICIEWFHNYKYVKHNQGIIFKEGDDVVGLYYQRGGNLYILLKDSHKMYLYFHLVESTRFLIQITKCVGMLPFMNCQEIFCRTLMKSLFLCVKKVHLFLTGFNSPLIH